MSTHRFNLRGLLVLALLSGGVAACGDEDENKDSQANDAEGDTHGDGDGEADAEKNIVETAVAAGDFSVLAQALLDTGLDSALAGKGKFTVFAPTDDAFDALGIDLSTLTSEQLADVLKYHVFADAAVTSNQVTAGPVSMLNGISAYLSTEGGVKINGASVTTADVQASNGVIHVIDKVLLPPNLVEFAAYAGFETLVGAAQAAGLGGALTAADAKLTVFAPTEEAFAAIEDVVAGLSTEELADVLEYHVVSGEVLSTDLRSGDVPTLNGANLAVGVGEQGVTLNGETKVMLADIVTINGVIHVIDSVLLPPSAD